jgi:hypothetical protein
MGRKLIPALIVFCLLFMGLAVPAVAQNSYVTKGANGYSFSSHSRFNTESFNSFGLYNGLSIGGRFSVFADFNYGFGKTELYLGLGGPEAVTGVTPIETIESNNLNLVLGIDLSVLKQSIAMPFNFNFFIAYGFDYIFSDQLADREYIVDDPRYELDTSVYQNFYQKDGSGFELGSSLYRDFFFIPQFAFRLGADISYRSYRYTVSYYIEDTVPDEVLTEEDETEPIFIEQLSREDLLLWGGIAGFSLWIDNAPVIKIELKVLFREFDFSRIYFEPSIGIVRSFYR